MTVQMPELKTQSVPALERGLLILESLSKSWHGITISQLTRNLGLPRSSIHALLLTFERNGYVYHDEASGRYRLGLRMCELANAALESIKVREQAAPLLVRLRNSTGLTVHLAILEREEVVLIEKMELPEVRTNSWIGKRIDLHCTALGKAVLAYLRDEMVETLLRKRGMLRHNDNTIVSKKRLKQDLEMVRKRGYAFDDEEEEINFRCIGAPILTSRNVVVGAISISGTTNEVDERTRDSLAASVRATAAAIARHVDEEELRTISSAECGGIGNPG
jgi:DNA-binding IclR family transcriptional regulator